MKKQGLKCFRGNKQKIIHHSKGVSKGCLVFKQHFKFVNWWIGGFGFLCHEQVNRHSTLRFEKLMTVLSRICSRSGGASPPNLTCVNCSWGFWRKLVVWFVLLRFDFLAEVQEETVLVDKVLVDTNSWFLQILFKFLDKNRLTVWFGFSSFLEIFFRFGLHICGFTFVSFS